MVHVVCCWFGKTPRVGLQDMGLDLSWSNLAPTRVWQGRSKPGCWIGLVEIVWLTTSLLSIVQICRQLSCLVHIVRWLVEMQVMREGGRRRRCNGRYWKASLTCFKISDIISNVEFLGCSWNMRIYEVFLFMYCWAFVAMRGRNTYVILGACSDCDVITVELLITLQASFGNSKTSLCTSKKSFAFLVQFLSDIVPYETGRYLKVTSL